MEKPRGERLLHQYLP